MPQAVKSSLAVALLRLLGALPLRASQALAPPLAWLLACTPNAARAHSEANLARCLPQLAPAARRRLLRASLRHTLYAALEMGANWCQAPARNLARIKQIKGAELLAADTPTVVLTPHLGNWELFATWAAQQVPLTALYTPAKLAGVDRLMGRARRRAGMALAPANGLGVRQLKKALKANQAVLILPDQEPPPQAGIESVFFGQPAYTMTLANQLAAAPQVRLLLGFARRQGRGFAIELEDISASRTDQLAASVAAMNKAVEGLVLRAPEQYQWEYRRFKHTLEIKK